MDDVKNEIIVAADDCTTGCLKCRGPVKLTTDQTRAVYTSSRPRSQTCRTNHFDPAGERSSGLAAEASVSAASEPFDLMAAY